MPWVRSPDAGGVKINEAVRYRTKKRLVEHAAKRYKGKYERLDIRFRGQFCYADVFIEPAVAEDWPPDSPESREEYLERLRNTPRHLFRLRYFGDENRWSFALFGYSDERYELTILPSGHFARTSPITGRRRLIVHFRVARLRRSRASECLRRNT